MIIEYQTYKFIISFLEDAELPPYKGSTLRGGFGHAFKKAVCVFRDRQCADCNLKQTCAYSYIFETSPPEETSIPGFGRYDTIPHPFVIEPPLDRRTGLKKRDELEFGLVLIGKAVKYLPYFVLAFERLGELGIGKGKRKYALQEVVCNELNIYEPAKRHLTTGSVKHIEIPESYTFDTVENEELALEFVTPVRIKYQRDSVVDLHFYILITNLLRRIFLLNYFHGERLEPGWDHRQIINEAKEIAIRLNQLRWYDWERYSSRQKTRMKLGGLIGGIVYYGPISPFRPLINVGELLHVGKGTSFGLGKYVIVK